MNKIKLFLALN